MKNLITKFLNLEPDDIQNIDVFSQDNQVFALITLTKKFYTCPKIQAKQYLSYSLANSFSLSCPQAALISKPLDSRMVHKSPFLRRNSLKASTFSLLGLLYGLPSWGLK